MWGAAKDLGGMAKSTIEEAKIGEKLSSVATTVSHGAMTAGTYVYDKTKTAAGAVKDKTIEISVNLK